MDGYSTSRGGGVRIALLGDLHEHWSPADVEAIDALGYDLVLFVGDLADTLHRRTLQVARAISPLRTPALLLPGNHDATTPFGVLAEAGHLDLRRPGAAARAVARSEALRAALGPVRVAGYSVHPFPDAGVTVVAARPHAMDGSRLCFPQALQALFGIATLEDSVRRLRALVDEARGTLVFLAHNGPTGLGTDRQAPFAVMGRDLGDPDLADAVAYARRSGRRVAAVVAGHIHHRGQRRWLVEQEGTVIVNAARVPRVWQENGREVRQHLELVVHDGRALVREVKLTADR
jgi:uncharacterized protein (TIGR04168 family)